MPTPTARLGLQLLADSEDISPQRTNFQRIDDITGALWVADGVTPSNATLFDGAIISEITSGKIWIARTNGVGGFTKKYISYPWFLSSFTSVVTVGSGGWVSATPSTFSKGKNATSADLVAGGLKIPINGVYSGYITANWAFNASGVRSIVTNLNSSAAADDNNTGANSAANGSATTHVATHFCDMYNAGDTLKANLYQSSGSTLTCVLVAYIKLEYPT